MTHTRVPEEDMEPHFNLEIVILPNKNIQSLSITVFNRDLRQGDTPLPYQDRPIARDEANSHYTETFKGGVGSKVWYFFISREKILFSINHGV